VGLSRVPWLGCLTRNLRGNARLVANEKVAIGTFNHRLVIQVFVAGEHEERRRVVAETVIRGRWQPQQLGAPQLRALADESLRPTRHLEMRGKLGDALVHLPKESLVSCLARNLRHIIPSPPLVYIRSNT